MAQVARCPDTLQWRRPCPGPFVGPGSLPPSRCCGGRGPWRRNPSFRFRTCRTFSFLSPPSGVALSRSADADRVCAFGRVDSCPGLSMTFRNRDRSVDSSGSICRVLSANCNLRVVGDSSRLSVRAAGSSYSHRSRSPLLEGAKIFLAFPVVMAFFPRSFCASNPLGREPGLEGERREMSARMYRRDHLIASYRNTCSCSCSCSYRFRVLLASLTGRVRARLRRERCIFLVYSVRAPWRAPAFIDEQTLSWTPHCRIRRLMSRFDTTAGSWCHELGRDGRPAASTGLSFGLEEQVFCTLSWTGRSCIGALVGRGVGSFRSHAGHRHEGWRP